MQISPTQLLPLRIVSYLFSECCFLKYDRVLFQVWPHSESFVSGSWICICEYGAMERRRLAHPKPKGLPPKAATPTTTFAFGNHTTQTLPSILSSATCEFWRPYRPAFFVYA